jgi:predicted NAD-dependent protein-ADP-ribosyltransferase YbiA (DUF1768 family)
MIQSGKLNEKKIMLKELLQLNFNRTALKTELLKTCPKTLVEASPSDTIWGIGLGAPNPKAQDNKTWRV